jgi:SPX domain protein involved in polyphosphate accumulation
MRKEYKYLIPKELINNVRNDMKPYIILDKYSEMRKEKQYTVRSIYYDTKSFDCYYEKIDGMKLKKKFRIRGYNSHEEKDIVFLEIKRKDESYIEKDRVPLKWEQLETLFLDRYNIPFAEGSKAYKDTGYFLYNYYLKKLLPTILVIYERESFYSKFNRDLRITFDKNLRSSIYPSLDSLYNNGNVKHIISHSFLLELKFYDNLPLWLRYIVLKYRLERIPFSKYALCIDSHILAKKFSRSIGYYY